MLSWRASNTVVAVVFTGQMRFLSPNQQRQSTEGEVLSEPNNNNATIGVTTDRDGANLIICLMLCDSSGTDKMRMANGEEFTQLM